MHLTRCDIALALAPFRRRPGTAAILVGLFAVACALTTVNTSLFLFLHTRPLPYPNHERLAWLGQASRAQRLPAGDAQTLDNALFLQSALRDIEHIATFNAWHNETLRHGETRETVTGCWITPGFFEVLGVKPALGATFADRTAVGASPRPLLLSARLWQRSFGGAASVLRQTVWLNDRPHVIVGVMPPDFIMPGLEVADEPEFWTPLDPREVPKSDWQSRWFPTLVLLEPGATLPQLQTQLDAATLRLRELFPAQMTERSLVAHDMKFWLLGAHLKYFHLLIATATLLSALIGVNLVNLLLGQLSDRAGYFQLSRALGAGPTQIMRPLVLEHLLLAAAGIVFAVPLALGYRYLLVTALANTQLKLPVFDAPWFVIAAFACTFVVLITLFLGARLLHACEARLVGTRASSRTIARSRGWLDGVAILGQTALAAMLLVAGSLLALSLRRQTSANQHLPLMEMQRAFLAVQPDKYPTHAVAIRQLLELKARLQARPDIAAAALAGPAIPGEGSPSYAMIDDQDTVPLAESPKRTIRPAACPDYFAAAGLKVVAGRVFSEHDLHSDRRLMVISQRAAELYWPGREPIGRRIRVNHRTDDWSEIIGVVQDIRFPTTDVRMPLVWRSFNHHPFAMAELVFQTRTRAPLPRREFERLLQAVAPELLLVEYGSVDDLLRRRRWMAEATAELSFLLAVVASAVCAFGLFSILNRRVAASMREIAVRKALGAGGWHIVASIGRRDLAWALAGIAVGSTFAIVGTPALIAIENLTTFERSATPAIAAATIVAGAMLGALVPTLRALAANPVPLLRGEN